MMLSCRLYRLFPNHAPGAENRRGGISLWLPTKPSGLAGDEFQIAVGRCDVENRWIEVRTQPPDYFTNLGARFRTVIGGEVHGYTELLTRSRNEARLRLWNEAQTSGANAVVAFQFDCNEIGGVMSEVAAYGTAVTVAALDSGPISL